MRFAVLDLGSSSFHLLVADAGPDGDITPLLRERSMLNLGLRLVGRGRIPRRAAEQAVFTIRRFRDLAARADVDRVLPVATSALRDASNRDELTEVLETAAGVPVRFIDGVEEARLVYAGVRASVSLERDPVAVLDLGGGSLEVAVGDRKGLRWADSLPLGAARLAAACVRHDPTTRAERHEIRRRVLEEMQPILEEISVSGRVQHVACGGTARALARLAAATRWTTPPASVNQLMLRTDELAEFGRTLAMSSREQRLALPGLDERRVDVLPIGALVLSAAFSALGAERIVVSEWGLREGVILEALGLADRPGPSPARLRAGAIDRLCHAWSVDESHGELVADLAGLLFDGTESLHEMGAHERELLRYAARVHDIGVRISPDRHHKHGGYLLEHAGLRGFAPEEVALLAGIVRFQRGGDPRRIYEPFASLSDSDQRSCNALVALLRVAHGLARVQSSALPEVSVSVGRRVRITVSRTPTAEMAAAEAQGESALLADVLGRAIEVRPIAVAEASA